MYKSFLFIDYKMNHNNVLSGKVCASMLWLINDNPFFISLKFIEYLLNLQQ